MPVNSFDDYPMSWRPTLEKGEQPIYRMLATQLEHDIKNGTLAPGTMLPPQRELADFLDINLSTITRAFKLCEQKGLLSASVGKGTFVSSDTKSNPILLSSLNDTPHSDSVIEMGAILPTAEEGKYITKHLQNLLNEPNSHQYLNYSSPVGTTFQQECAVSWLKKGGCIVDSNQVLFTNGSQNAICCILSSLFQTGDKVATPALIYPGIKTVATMLGIQLVPIPLEEDSSISIDALKNICKNENIKGLYLIPDFNNPTTVTMTSKQRKEVADLAIRHDLLIIEDAIYTLLRPDDAILKPVQAYAPDNTIYLMSLSKTITPGLRIALIGVPKRYMKELSIAVYNNTIAVSALLTECSARIIHNGIADEIRCKRREEIIQRSKQADSILAGYVTPCDITCNFRYIKLPDSFTSMRFEQQARKAGVQVYAVERFAVGNCFVPKAVRIGISSPSTFEECKEGLMILKQILSNEYPMSNENDFTYLL